MVGAGRINFVQKGGHDYFFVTEPGITLNFFLTNWFGLGVGTSYLFASGVDYEGYTDSSLNSSAYSIDFKFQF